MISDKEDLKVRSFIMLRIYDKPNTYNVPIYVCTDKVLIGVLNNRRWCYETMVCLDNGYKQEFLTIQERCFSELEAFSQHKLIYKKIKKHLYDNEIIEIIEREGFINE